MINITIVTHSGLFVIHIASFVLKIPYLIPAICHQQLMRGWLIIQPSHAWLQPVSVNCRGGRKKASVSVWSVLTIRPPRLRVNNADPRCPRHHPPSLWHRTPGVPGVHWEQWDEMVAPYSSCVRAPSSRTRLSHASSVTRVMRETRPGDAAPCLLLRVTFTGKSRAWCETGADAPFTSAAAPGSGPSYRRMAAGKPGELRTPGPWLRQLETLKWSNTPSLQQSHHSFSSQLSGVAVGQRNIFGERHHSRCHHQIIFSKSSEACDNTRHR